MTLGLSLLVFASGAILRFAVTTSVAGIDLQTVGVILMIVGAVGLLVTLVMLLSRRDDVRTRPPY